MIWMLGGYMWLFVHRPFEYWPVLGAMQIERLYVVIMALVWAGTPDKGLVPNRIHAAVLFFTLVLLATWVASPYMDKGADTVENYFKVALFYLMVVTTVRDEKSLRRLVGAYLLAVGLYMLHSLWEYHNGRYEWRQGIHRLIGVDMTFNDPNAFASSVVFSLPLTLPFWADRPRWRGRLLLIGYTGTVCLCVALTGSRAGMIGLCAFGMMTVLVSVRRKVLALVAGALAGSLALGIAAVALPGELQDRYLTIIDSSRGPKNAQESASGRMDGLMFGLAAWQQSPLLGHGPSSFGLATGRGGGAHNLYGQVLSETGLLGAVALAGLLFCFWRNWTEARRLCSGPLARPRGLAFHVARAVALDVVLLAFLGWSGHNLYRYNWLWYAAFGACALHCVRSQAAPRRWAMPRRTLPPSASLQPAWRGA
jgi:O-antigen ligase